MSLYIMGTKYHLMVPIYNESICCPKNKSVVLTQLFCRTFDVFVNSYVIIGHDVCDITQNAM